MRCLVTGGAGYIGSHVAQYLLDKGHEVVILDNLSTGHKAALPSGAEFRNIDLADAPCVYKALSSGGWDVVMHFAALSLVGASMERPYDYLRSNTLTSLNLIEACVRHGVKRFVFSSTAALFGGKNLPPIIPDTAPIEPASPYGESKLVIERALKWADRIHGMRHACLRYFNAAGSDPRGRLGEDHHPETHLIPLAIDALLGRRPALTLFGNDYATRDGTCIRDYIHVTDLADAHVRVIDKLEGQSVTYNLGNGTGFSNLEVVKAIEHVSGRKLPWTWGPRRMGDPASLVADSCRFRADTGWTPLYPDIEKIVETALKWRMAHPDGYKNGYKS